ncbi:DEAD/DEAH box helicase family protein [bacterium]|nr:DEAD/DEAH box helicase family protein [bacterium]
MNDYIEQAKTLNDLRQKLNKYNKCAIIRPTGFGKTFMLTELIKDYNNVLYVYPSAVIRDTVVDRYYDSMFDTDTACYIDEDGNELDPETVDTCIAMKSIPNCTLMTYTKLAKLTDDDFKQMHYDLILLDEAHRVGAAMTKIATEKLFTHNKKAHFVGATATPLRMDNFDVISVFFSDIMVYSYTIFDAIQDGMLKKPNYCYCTYDIETDLKETALTAGEDITDPIVRDVINAKCIEMAKIFNLPTIIKSTCDQYASTTEYMKFIVFFSNKTHMSEKLNEVIGWFKEAYPSHTVNTLKISSRTKEEHANTEKLNELIYKKNHIDLIACIDMLNMGYHVNNQTGIIMYRGTKSNTIFTQQLGRALSAGSDNSAIVFDIVDNLHRKAIYELKSSLSKKKTKKSSSKSEVRKTHYFLSDDGSTILTLDKNQNAVITQYHLDENNNIVDINNIPSTLSYDDDTGDIYDNGSLSYKDVNRITAECLTATGHEATYREILAKALAEPLTQRCKFALELHFRTWCHNHNVPYPITDAELEKLHGLSKQDFYNEFCKVLRKNKVPYPLKDIKALLNMGSDGTDDVPLAICAKARNVSISQILDMLGVA